METFAGEWFSKTNWEAGGISRRKAAGFLRVAMRKVTGELRAGSGLNVE